MKKSELRQIIKEEINKILKEEEDRYTSDWDEGIYIELKKPLNPEMEKKIAQAAKKKFFADIEFKINPSTKNYSVFVPFAGDWANMKDILDKYGIQEKPYSSPNV